MTVWAHSSTWKVPTLNQRRTSVKWSHGKSCQGDNANFEAIGLDLREKLRDNFLDTAV